MDVIAAEVVARFQKNTASTTGVTSCSVLIMLPKPIVAFVERDHFISVTNADAHGVTL